MQPLVLRWPGGEHACRLGLSELEVIQQKTDCGPEYLLHRISAAQWRTVDLIEVIRNGLIGGGMDHVQALRLVRDAFDAHPVVSFKVPAQALLAHALYGPPEDEGADRSGEQGPVQPTPASEKTANGHGEPSGATA